MIDGIIAFLSDPATYSGRFALQTLLAQHVYYTVVSTLVAMAIAVPTGLWIGHRRRGELVIVTAANTGRAVPDFGIIILAFLVFGLTNLPVFIALVALAVPPILVNTYVGVRQVEADLTDAAAGMGMSGWQVLTRVELPVAVPLIAAGVRTAAVQVVATATLAGYIGLGGLGRLIFDGLREGIVRGGQPGLPKVAIASLLVAVLAILTELALARLEGAVTPAGIALAAEPGPGDVPGPDRPARTTGAAG